MDFLHVLYLAVVTTIVWFIVGGILYMNPFVAKVYAKYNKLPVMKHFKTQMHYLAGVFIVAGFIPILLIAVAYQYIGPLDFVIFGLILSGIRIVPRMCDMWMQSSYPNKLLLIELVNGIILSFVIAYMFAIL